MYNSLLYSTLQSFLSVFFIYFPMSSSNRSDGWRPFPVKKPDCPVLRQNQKSRIEVASLIVTTPSWLWVSDRGEYLLALKNAAAKPWELFFKEARIGGLWSGQPAKSRQNESCSESKNKMALPWSVESRDSDAWQQVGFSTTNLFTHA